MALMRPEELAAMVEWEAVLASGKVTHVRPHKWCGVWQLHAYNRNAATPLLGSISDHSAAIEAVRRHGISIEDLNV